MYTNISEREVGQFPLSIATSLALESAVNIHPDVKHKVLPLTEYDELWVNVRTLFRNLFGSMTKEMILNEDPTSFAEAIEGEMTVIEQIVKDFGRPGMHVVFYVSDYRGMEQKYKHAKLRMDRTAKQLQYTAIQTATIGKVLQYCLKEKSQSARCPCLSIEAQTGKQAQGFDTHSLPLRLGFP